jgi:hypothetical protein
MAVLDLLAKLIANMSYARQVCFGFRVALLTTFIVSMISVFAVCRPFNKFWQIYPDPGSW